VNLQQWPMVCLEKWVHVPVNFSGEPCRRSDNVNSRPRTEESSPARELVFQKYPGPLIGSL